LTHRLGLHGRGARDFLDALVALRLLDRDEDERYSNVPTCSAYLDPGQLTHIGGLLEYLNARMYQTWDYLTPALLQGKAQCGPAVAGGFQNYYADGAALALFLKGMTGGSRLVARSLAENFPWKRIGR
jgi:hypothetical protein